MQSEQVIIAKTGEDRYCLMKVQEGFFKHEIIRTKMDTLHIKTTDRIGESIFSETIPPGNWQIVGIGRELTSEQWKGIVHESVWAGDRPSWGYKNYLSNNGRPLDTATESGFSWLRSHGADETFLILKDNG